MVVAFVAVIRVVTQRFSVIRVVTQHFSSTSGKEALRDDPNRFRRRLVIWL